MWWIIFFGLVGVLLARISMEQTQKTAKFNRFFDVGHLLFVVAGSIILWDVVHTSESMLLTLKTGVKVAFTSITVLFNVMASAAQCVAQAREKPRVIKPPNL
ncbi:MAG: hypothetical protein A3H01_00985 [Candidatus Wildermuthbacteria bacterium RIFCSPLOWO2_12_FULL_40_9]|uniref:Uncharacterized protein n=2 Tax=Candidatus Wildermuthiibacteriota TaxID=1817923 RepID=A0A1G2RF95_9BACT|nr:MAG: hypothetical protein A3F15_02205 [Candidatus Wildermuthbacteria bacterium RIFCSPHIGHO2_12_FULL_40_12]OHA76833.1 MAG: hypothetical protein A3H01_00985 [Candidatus Wildermuthbacteria bacterium RIFCSPLOWO2_12_FULL_40_9]